MADPISIISTIWSTYKLLKDLQDKIWGNKERFKLLFNRLKAVMETLKQMEDSPKLTSAALTNLNDTLEVIKKFVNQDRFMKKKKFNLHLMEAVRGDDDMAMFSSLNDRLNRCSLDLNLDITMSIAKRQQEDDAANREDKYNNEQLLKEFMFQMMQDISYMRMTMEEIKANYHKIQTVVELPSSITSDATTVSTTSSTSLAASPYKHSVTIRGISKDRLVWNKITLQPNWAKAVSARCIPESISMNVLLSSIFQTWESS